MDVHSLLFPSLVWEKRTIDVAGHAWLPVDEDELASQDIVHLLHRRREVHLLQHGPTQWLFNYIDDYALIKTVISSSWSRNSRQKPTVCEPASVANSWQNFPASQEEKLTGIFTILTLVICSTVVTFFKKYHFTRGTNFILSGRIYGYFSLIIWKRDG